MSNGDTCIPGIPGKPSDNGGVIAYLKELLQLSPAQLIATSIVLQKRLSATTTTGTDEYRVPADRDLVVFQVQTGWKPTLMATEVVVNAIFTAFTPEDMAEIRTGNCLVNVLNKDRQLKLFDSRDMPMNLIRKTPLYFPANAPWLVPATHTLQAGFTLQDTTAAVVGVASDYAITLTGVLIPKRI